jgi:hypothetical protein
VAQEATSELRVEGKVSLQEHGVQSPGRRKLLLPHSPHTTIHLSLSVVVDYQTILKKVSEFFQI